jgi:hypothetical protein
MRIKRPRLARGGASFHLAKKRWAARGGVFLLLTLELVALLPAPATSQEWNDPTTLQMIRDARALRHRDVRDPDFRSYSSQARGYVHFFLDRRDTNERILVKTDQIALAVFWRAPNRIHQRIIGLRDEKSLPTNIRYHLDHLMVVQDDFADRIRIGDGDEVEAVLHPVGPGAEEFYDFSLADSITLTLQGAPEPIRVYEILVRPKDPEIPAFVGSVFLDRASWAIVRMSFTFTPASYVDPYLDHIRIALENGLWNGRFWLPYRQQLEIRREVPWLDIPAGTVIKGWFEIRDYEINRELPAELFRGPAVTTLPEVHRRTFPFEDSLHAHLEEEGLRQPPEMAEIRAMALELSRERYLSGLRRSRLHLPTPIISSGIRFNRAEGVFLGVGASFHLHPSLSTQLHGGYSFGRERPQVRWTLDGGEQTPERKLSLFLSHPRYLGPLPTAPGLLNSLAGLLFQEDYQDLYFATGVQASHRWGAAGGASLALLGRWEEHQSGRDVVSSNPRAPSFRPVLRVEEGQWRSFEATLTLPLRPEGLAFRTTGILGELEGEGFGLFTGSLEYHQKWLTRGLEFRGELRGGLLSRDGPRQALFLLGGRGTLPGHPYRSVAGSRYWLLQLQASRTLMAPWLSLRAIASAGGASLEGVTLPEPWPGDNNGATLLSAGLGVGLGWDVLHLELARGLTRGGNWELVFSVNPSFWGWL